MCKYIFIYTTHLKVHTYVLLILDEITYLVKFLLIPYLVI